MLTTSTAKLKVSSSHRVVKKSVCGEEVVCAIDLKDGDWIFDGLSPVQVSVHCQVMETCRSCRSCRWFRFVSVPFSSLPML